MSQKPSPQRTSTMYNDPWCERDEIIQAARLMKLKPTELQAKYLAWLVETDTEPKKYVREDPLFFDEWVAKFHV